LKTRADWGPPEAGCNEKAMMPMREEQAALSSRGQHRIVSGCDHSNLPVVRPEAVADAVRRILEVLRSEQPSGIGVRDTITVSPNLSDVEG
jgi:hypothetical protein